MKKRSLLHIILIVSGALIVILAIVVGLQPRTPHPSPVTSEEENFPEVPRVSLTEARKAYDAQSAVFIDVRDTSAYQDAHVPGALSFPLAQLETQLNQLSKSDWIITYCT
jgi:3-mercaptopyruvate sulfurtransferase SseA